MPAGTPSSSGSICWDQRFGTSGGSRARDARKACAGIVRSTAGRVGTGGVETVARAVATCQSGGVQTVYEAAGGADGMLRLAEAWHQRVLADEVVEHAFSHGFRSDHTLRLAAYWSEALGGPPTYTEQYGDEATVVAMHSGNGPHAEMDQRAIACFDQALVDVALADDDRLRQVLHDYFAWATTTTMSAYADSADEVPDGLELPHWSWDGLVSPS